MSECSKNDTGHSVNSDLPHEYEAGWIEGICKFCGSWFTEYIS